MSMIEQLKDLRENRKSFLDGDPEHDAVFLADISALDKAIELLEAHDSSSLLDDITQGKKPYTQEYQYAVERGMELVETEVAKIMGKEESD